jgi:ABC-type nitrate/sulfonate/bicarbonate transport system substrate-binding protein
MHSCRRLAALLAVLCAVGCSAGAQPPAATGRSETAASVGGTLPAADAPPSRPAFGEVRFVFPVPAMTMLPMQIASVQGFDREEGFTATFLQAPGTTGVRALQAGEVDFSESAGASLAAAVQGAPVRIVIVHVAKSLFWLYAQRDLTQPGDLRGRIDRQVEHHAQVAVDLAYAAAIVLSLESLQSRQREDRKKLESLH